MTVHPLTAHDGTVFGSVPVDRPVTLVLQVPGGSVEVDATGDDAVVTVHVEPLNRAAEDLLDRLDLTVDADTVSLVVPERRRSSVRGGPEFALRTTVPAGSGLRALTASAEVSVTGVLGEVDVSTASGDVELPRVGGGRVAVASGDLSVGEVDGSVSVESASGEVSVGRAGESVRARSASGGVRVGEVGGDLAATSASGDVEIGRVAGRLTAQTASGDVAVAVVVGPLARLTTLSGDVRVGVPDGTAVWLDVKTLSGDLHSEFAGSGSGPGSGEPVDGEQVLDLAVSTLSGDVDVRRV